MTQYFPIGVTRGGYRLDISMNFPKRLGRHRSDRRSLHWRFYTLLRSFVHDDDAFEVSEVFTFFFNQIMTMKMKLPKSLTASRLIALQKAGGGVRPIAVGESIARILSSLIFNRISKEANIDLLPFQFGIKTIDGASSAVLSSETLFLASSQNLIFNLDFKIAFNSVKRSVIHEDLPKHFPEILPYYYHF
ncbi:hypothetical protein RCL1_000343 [Eukaryota sp. TZLM3-RCL]